MSVTPDRVNEALSCRDLLKECDSALQWYREHGTLAGWRVACVWGKRRRYRVAAFEVREFRGGVCRLRHLADARWPGKQWGYRRHAIADGVTWAAARGLQIATYETTSPHNRRVELAQFLGGLYIPGPTGG